MTRFEQARNAERQYHIDLYNKHELFEPGSWLRGPAKYATDAMRLVEAATSGVRVLDLGTGVGRHSIPAAQYFGGESEITCVDLLPEAIEKLIANAKNIGVEKQIVGVVGDVEKRDFGSGPYDLVLSVSCIEHVSSFEELIHLIRRLQSLTSANGVHCFMITTDSVLIDAKSGKSTEPIMEQNLDFERISTMLIDLYSSWLIHDLSEKKWSVDQGEGKMLNSVCVQLTAQKNPLHA